MYTPKDFRQDDLKTLHAFMQNYPFATLVSSSSGTPSSRPQSALTVTHLPFILDPETGASGTLWAHMARANTHWRAFSPEEEVLVIFQGPHAYISPSWYEEKLSVPTWNYAAIHAYGIPRLSEDPQVLYQLLQKSVNTFESGFAQPWVLDPPDDFLEPKMRAIVGFSLEITRLEGKFKMSQNRSLVEQATVAAQLQLSTDSAAVQVGDFIAARLASKQNDPK